MIQQKDIASHLQSKNFSVTWNSSIAYEGNAVLAPGTLKHHYMPQSPLVVSSDPLPPEQVLQQIFQKYSHRGNIALTSEPKENQQNEIPVLSQIDPHQIGYLELPLTDPTLCARLLYHEFHQKSKRYPLLFLYWPASHTGGDWAPIWERITKAATIRLGLFAQVT
ncbi:MAG: hypothetical protein N3A60_11620 [Thermanaerothrix sp.]|nr:hypothetical protein [Thermanaerothrix sp.]